MPLNTYKAKTENNLVPLNTICICAYYYNSIPIITIKTIEQVPTMRKNENEQTFKLVFLIFQGIQKSDFTLHTVSHLGKNKYQTKHGFGTTLFFNIFDHWNLQCCADLMLGGMRLQGTVGGRGSPFSPKSHRCIARINSSQVSLPSCTPINQSILSINQSIISIDHSINYINQSINSINLYQSINQLYQSIISINQSINHIHYTNQSINQSIN